MQKREILGTLEANRLPKNGYVRSVISAISCFNKHIFASTCSSVFLKEKKHVLFKKKTCFFFLRNTVEKKQGSKCFFFSKPPVFKLNIHNLSQFVNHTVTLVQNKNNNEGISLK